jgi:transcriptional regulator with XRE-family HTH domain
MARTTYRPENLVLAGLLRSMREEAGLTQAEVGERLGRSQSFVSDYEAGQRRLDLVDLLDLSGLLGVELSEVVDRFVALVSEQKRSARSRERPRVKKSVESSGTSSRRGSSPGRALR